MTPPSSTRTTESADAELEQLEMELLLTGIARRYGYDFREYAVASLRRRLRWAMLHEGVLTLSQLQERILRDPEALERLVASMSVQTTAMFRDPTFYLAVRRSVVPLLRTYPFIRIWHAGCATGEEVYSIAVLLVEEGLYDKGRIYATDISDAALVNARNGAFPLSQMQRNTRNYQRSGGKRDFSSYYAVDNSHAVFDPALRRNIVFSQHNLASDGCFNEFNLVLCRNVLIYFNPSLRDRVIGLLHDSLCRFGVIGVGMKESLRFVAHAASFEELDGPARLYRRIS